MFVFRRSIRSLVAAIAFSTSILLTLAAALVLPSARADFASVRPLYATVPGSAGVTIGGFAFQPQIVTISVGSRVTWTNTDPVSHTTTSDIGFWDSGEIGPGGVFSQTFDTPGTYTYHCAIHSFMTGTVTVLTSLYLPLLQRNFGP
jgi:plastocyanin